MAGSMACWHGLQESWVLLLPVCAAFTWCGLSISLLLRPAQILHTRSDQRHILAACMTPVMLYVQCPVVLQQSDRSCMYTPTHTLFKYTH